MYEFQLDNVPEGYQDIALKLQNIYHTLQNDPPEIIIKIVEKLLLEIKEMEKNEWIVNQSSILKIILEEEGKKPLKMIYTFILELLNELDEGERTTVNEVHNVVMEAGKKVRRETIKSFLQNIAGVHKEYKFIRLKDTLKKEISIDLEWDSLIKAFDNNMKS